MNIAELVSSAAGLLGFIFGLFAYFNSRQKADSAKLERLDESVRWIEKFIPPEDK